MANVLHRTADPVDYRTSVNTAEYSVIDWFINPDVSLVAAVPTKYWSRPLADPVTEMSAPEKAAVDAAEAAAETSSKRAEAVAAPDDLDSFEGVQLRELFEVFNKRDNYILNRLLEIHAAMNAMKASSGGASTIRDAIPASWLATSTRTRADAIQDYKDGINSGGADT